MMMLRNPGSGGAYNMIVDNVIKLRRINLDCTRGAGISLSESECSIGTNKSVASTSEAFCAGSNGP